MIKSIFLIDDDADDAELFEETLNEIDSVIIFNRAKDGCEALEILEEGIIIPDLIFLDINMPRMDGWQCLGKFKSKDLLKDIPVIMYSTSSNQKDKEIAIKLGAINFISKPSNLTELKNILQAVIANG
ncbi:MAG: response regulator [Bacteroidia bacterium]